MKKVFVVLASILFLASVASAIPIVSLNQSVGALSMPITSPLFVGSVLSSENDGTGGINDDAETVQVIINAWNGASILVNGGFQLPDLYEVGNDPKIVPYMENEDVGTWDVRAISLDFDGEYKYLSFKYAENVDLWYIEGLIGIDYIFPSTGTFSNDLSHYRMYSPVPEPATMLLLGTGLLGLGAISRKKVFKK